MAKSRMVSQEIAEDSKIAHCSDEAALTYAFTIPFLDRDGLCSGKPSWIGGRALQERPHLQHMAGKFIGEWVAQGLVIRYDGNDGPVLFFPGFRKHNANMPYEKEQRSKFPPPPGYHRDQEGKIGLIPNDPEEAGRLAEVFDVRSSYRKALTEAAGSKETLAQSLGLDDKPTPTSHNEVTTYSRPTHDQVDTNGIEVEVEDQENRREENTNHNARGRTLVEFATSLLMPEWNGGGDFLSTLNDKELLIAANWLWLYQKLKGQGEYSMNEYASRYKPSPFAKVDNPPGFIRRKIEKHEPVKLHYTHRVEFNEELRELTGEFQS